MKKFVAIILARKGSEAIKNKNLMKICGKPLVDWSIQHCKNSKLIYDVWLSSDSEKILQRGRINKINTILRPDYLAKSNSSSEVAWLQAVKYIEKFYDFDYVVGIQPTSPIRDKNDIDNSIKHLNEKKFDSLFTSSVIQDYFIWKKSSQKLSANYNYKKRKVRQKIKEQYLENGSIYIFNKNKFLKHKCRLFGKIGTYVLDSYKKFQIDEIKDKFIIESIMDRLIKFNGKK